MHMYMYFTCTLYNVHMNVHTWTGSNVFSLISNIAIIQPSFCYVIVFSDISILLWHYSSSSLHVYMYVSCQSLVLYIFTFTKLYLHVHSVSPKGWYHGTPPSFSLAPPSFNFKIYAEKHCFITRIEHH